MVLRCAHCDEPVSQERPLIKRFFPPAQPGVDENEAVEISDAVKKIFEWKCNGKRRFKIEKKIQVCHECGKCLGKLYASILSFDFLKTNDSYINQGILKDQAEEDIQRYREGIKRKSMNTEFITPNLIGKTSITVSPGTSSQFSLVNQGMEKEEAVEYVEEPVGATVEEIEYDQDDIAMEDDEEGDPDFEFHKSEAKQRYSRSNKVETVVEPVVLGIDDAPPSPRAAAAPVVDLEHKTFLCQLCPKGFGTNQGLRTHLLLTHEIGNKAKEHACLHCGKTFFYEYLLKNHSKVHSDEKPVECPICPSRFKTKLALVHHQKNVHAASDRPFKCSECGKSYKEARSLREHVNITHIASGPVFKCKFGCGSTTSRKRSMLSHYRRCRKRPGAENEEPTPRKRRETSETSVSRKNQSKENLFSCKWGCGKIFMEKKAAMRHNVYNCTHRPYKPSPGSLLEPKQEPQEPKTEPYEMEYEIGK